VIYISIAGAGDMAVARNSRTDCWRWMATDFNFLPQDTACLRRVELLFLTWMERRKEALQSWESREKGYHRIVC
jgi:hypothetical protein